MVRAFEERKKGAAEAGPYKPLHGTLMAARFM
jgi:hypothetical protein